MLALCAWSGGAEEFLIDAHGDYEGVGVHAHGGSRSAQAGGAGQLSMQIPYAGSLGPISGVLRTPPGGLAPQQYKFCVYLESTAAGQSLYNGPKPAENDDSFSPIAADGTFAWAGWYANDALDPVSPFVLGFAFPIALGNCIAVLGTPIYPLRMEALSIAYTRLPRANTFALSAQGVSALGSTLGFTVRLTGMPPNPVELALLLYYSEDGGATFSGPLPSCTPRAALPWALSADGQQGLAVIPDGLLPPAANTVTLVLVAAAVHISPTPVMFQEEHTGPVICATQEAPLQGQPLPVGANGMALATLQLTRLPPLPTASATASASATATALPPQPPPCALSILHTLHTPIPHSGPTPASL